MHCCRPPHFVLALRVVCDAFTCPEALLWLTALTFYQMRSRIFPTSALFFFW